MKITFLPFFHTFFACTLLIGLILDMRGPQRPPQSNPKGPFNSSVNRDALLISPFHCRELANPEFKAYACPIGGTFFDALCLLMMAFCFRTQRSAGIKYGVPNGTKLRKFVVKRAVCLPAKSAKLSIKRHLAQPLRRSNMLNLVPLYGVPGIRR